MVTPIPAAGPPIASYIKAHDAFFRHVFGHVECRDGLVRYAWKELKLEAAVTAVDPSFTPINAEVTVLDASFTGGTSADLVLQVAETPPIVLLFEHKANRDPRTGFQLMGYALALSNRLRKQGPIVVPIVFYHGTRRWSRIAAPRIVGFSFAPSLLDLRHFGRARSMSTEDHIGAHTTAALLVMARVRHESTTLSGVNCCGTSPITPRA